jgi:hypothetical protein
MGTSLFRVRSPVSFSQGEERNITILETNIPKPENIITSLLGCRNRPKEVEVIREIEEGKELREEVKERTRQKEEKEKEIRSKPIERKGPKESD